MKGLPLAYNRDLQEDKPPVFAARRDLRLSLDALAVLVGELTFDRGRLAAACSDPLLLATDVAEQLVGEGVPFREAHERVAASVRAGTFEPPGSTWSTRRARTGRRRGGARGRAPPLRVETSLAAARAPRFDGDAVSVLSRRPIGWIEALPAIIAFGVVLVVGLAGGGFFPRSWRLTLLALLLISAAALVAREGITIRRREWLALAAFGALTAWTFASAEWSSLPTGSRVESERMLLYTVALLAVLVGVGRPRCRSFSSARSRG